MRAIEVVESLGSKESVEVLKAWAGGAPEAVLTRQARIALGSR
jgi:hypothetical protein